MKKYIRLLIIAMAVIFIMPNVNAREFTIDNFNFSIEGVKINLYKIEKENNVINPEDCKNYALKNPTQVVNVDYTKFNYSPKYAKYTNKYSEDDIEKGAYIDLDFGIDKELIKTYLSKYIDTTTEDNAYLFDVVLQLKLTSIPSNAQDIVLYNNSVRNALADHAQMENYEAEVEFEKNKTNDYVFAGGSIINKELTFENHALKVEADSLEEGSELDAFFNTAETEMNYNVTSFIDFIDSYDKDDNHVFSLALFDFADFDDLMEFLEKDSDFMTLGETGDLKELTYETIPVPNTALDFSKVIYVFGYILIIGGAYLLLRFKTKKGSN